MKRILLGALVGGVIVFIWSALSHMILPMGEMGISQLPSEDAVVGAMRSSIPEPGLYFFPGMGTQGEMTEELMAAWEARMKAGPIGLLVYDPAGDEGVSPKRLLTELLSNIFSALIAAWIIARVAGSTPARALMIGAMGLFAWFSISASYWNWYHFPSLFVFAEALDQVVGWTLAGSAMAAIVKPTPA